VCGASRASLLTGIRPTRDRFVNYSTWAEMDYPEAVTLPEYFKQQGYFTISNGKIFHHLKDCRESWNEDPWRPDYDTSTTQRNWRNYLKKENIIIAGKNENKAGPPFEKADVLDSAYYDGQIADKTISDLKRMNELDQPFFIATGFLKPHLPFNAPTKYWDLYKREDIDLADNPFRSKGAPDVAFHNWGELRAYHGITSTGSLSEEMAKTLVHGYYACVSYTDAQIGRILRSLDDLELQDNTIVVLWGDHGWNLGEHGLWCKHCNFETSLHSPLILSVPSFKNGNKIQALTEFVDIYPSLCELTGLPIPTKLEGTSFVPLMKDPDRKWKSAAFSRFKNGESIKTDRYRYTEYSDNQGKFIGRMLYDHQIDPGENINVSELPESDRLVQDLSTRLKQGWKTALPF
jgi:arylsulfatase A-like enzyme